jgi:hypothetical protein
MATDTKNTKAQNPVPRKFPPSFGVRIGLMRATHSELECSLPSI